MADYRDLAIALGGGYGQDTGPITADTLITLKNGKKATAGDLLGMLKGFGQAVGSNLESLGRVAYQHFWVRLWIPQTRLGHLTQWKCLGM
jgi:hypothetical protein